MTKGTEIRYRVRGSAPLQGTVFIQGAKNAALKLMAAATLTAKWLTPTIDCGSRLTSRSTHFAGSGSQKMRKKATTTVLPTKDCGRFVILRTRGQLSASLIGNIIKPRTRNSRWPCWKK